jgi:hypothetical protein
MCLTVNECLPGLSFREGANSFRFLDGESHQGLSNSARPKAIRL